LKTKGVITFISQVLFGLQIWMCQICFIWQITISIKYLSI